MSFLDPRRIAPRITVDGLCGVVAGSDLRHASMTELSPIGLRLELPFDAATATSSVWLEIELPNVDEIVWARGQVSYARLSPMGGFHANGQPKLWCRAGLSINAVSSSDRRMLRDYVIETRRASRRLEAA